jgi:hypothetical protein
MSRTFLPGLELARLFYTEVVVALLSAALSDVPFRGL